MKTASKPVKLKQNMAMMRQAPPHPRRKNSQMTESLTHTKALGFADFASLVNLLGTSTKTNDKLEALAEYFTYAGSSDKVWVIALFSGRKPRRSVNSTILRNWCAEITGLPMWLFEESYHTVGDLAETIALLLPPPSGLIVQEITLSF